MPKFIGREKELNNLISIWQQACQGKPQIVNLVADTGLGKTRLIQAFYEWLSTDPTQGDDKEGIGYWPDDLGVGRQRVVNPSLERFKPFNFGKNRIPWLWWGMYWTDAANDIQNALVDNSAFLDVHLKMLEIDRSSDKSAFRELKDATVDVVKDSAQNLPVIGQFVAPAFLVYRLGKALYDKRKYIKEMQEGPIKHQKNHLETLANDFIARLHDMFKSTKPVPMVLFLDDIHFAIDVSHDVKTLEFLESLLRQAAVNQWPLLVITTHWKSPWQAHLQAGPDQGKPWRKIVEQLKADKNCTDKLGFHDFVLAKMPEADLQKIALDHLPGLSEANLNAILAKVDNVRWLVEVLNALNDNLENFENKDRSQDLSRIGLSRLKVLLTQQGYLGVIRQRLKGEEMSDIRAALGAMAWHSYGLDFLGPLADAFESGLIEQNLLGSSNTDAEIRIFSALMRALDPASLIEGDTNGEYLPDIIRFPERGYLEVARELFDESHAHSLSQALGQRVMEWMHSEEGMPRWQKLDSIGAQKVFLGIAIEVLGKLQPQLTPEQERELATKVAALRSLVQDGVITEEKFAEKQQAFKAEMLAGSASSNLDGASHYQAMAMAGLVELLRDEGIGKAWDLAYQLADHTSLEEIRDKLTVDAQLALGMS